MIDPIHSESKLLELFIKGSILLLLAALGSALARNWSAAFRHLVWCSAILGVVLLPVCGWILPAWPVSVSKANDVTAAIATDSDSSVVPRSLSELGSAKVTERNPLRDPREQPTKAHLITFVWLLGIFVVATPVMVGWISVWCVTRRSRGSDLRCRELLERACLELGVRQHVGLYCSDSLRIPVTWGVLRPVLLLPGEAVNWPSGRLRMILLHELAHIKRCDWLSQNVASLACALYWFNPLVWFAARRMRIERELACDDLVLNAGTPSSDYAHELLRFAAGPGNGGLFGLGTVPVVRPSNLERRLVAILDRKRNRSALRGRLFAAAMLVTIMTLVPVGMLRAERAAIPADAEGERRAKLPFEFGPTIEREIFDLESDTKPSMINLESGSLISTTDLKLPDNQRFFAAVEQALKSMRARGVDLVGDTSGKTFSGIDMLIVPIDQDFERISAERIMADRRLEGPVETQTEITVHVPPKTFLFKTRQNGPRGALQIMSFSQNLESMKIRYKFVRAQREFVNVNLTIPADSQSRFLALDDLRFHPALIQGVPMVYLDISTFSLQVENVHNYLVPPEKAETLWRQMSGAEIAEPAGLAGLPFERSGSYRLQPHQLPLVILIPEYGILRITKIDTVAQRVFLEYKRLESQTKVDPPGRGESTRPRASASEYVTPSGTPRAEPEARLTKTVATSNAVTNFPGVTREIFRSVSDGSGQTSWNHASTQNDLHQRRWPSMRVKAHAGDRWPVQVQGQAEPLFHGRLISGNDDAIRLEIDATQLDLNRDEPRSIQIGESTLRLTYASTYVEGDLPHFVDHVNLFLQIVNP